MLRDPTRAACLSHRPRWPSAVLAPQGRCSRSADGSRSAPDISLTGSPSLRSGRRVSSRGISSRGSGPRPRTRSTDGANPALPADRAGPTPRSQIECRSGWRPKSLVFQRPCGRRSSREMYPAVIGCLLCLTSKAVAQRLLALDIYYEATATPHRCGTKRGKTATMGCRKCGDEHAPTEVRIQ